MQRGDQQESQATNANSTAWMPLLYSNTAFKLCIQLITAHQ